MAISLQAAFMLMAALIFIKSKEQLFGWYALYCFLMFVYCATKTPDFIYPAEQVKLWKSHHLYNSFYWYIQILYHITYLSFGIRFVNLSAYRPKLFKHVLQYQSIILALSTVIYLAATLKFINVSLVLDFFLFIFMPLHIILSLVLLVIIMRLPKKYYTYITGALCYMLLILLAFTLSYYQTGIGPVRGPAVFYIGVALESGIFSLGLGLRIRNIYQEKLFFQYILNETNQKLQQELGRQLEAQQREKELLTELSHKQELDIQVEKLHNQVLRSQLNSHFVFNVLNSIRLFILEHDTNKAAKYLSSFSKFIRQVLNSSMHEYHSLKQELDMIELYINIEKVRLGSDFEFTILAEDNIPLNEIKMPALLLQPVVENALWHGIMQAKSEKKISIRVFKDTEKVVIQIDDTGPGIQNLKKTETIEKGKSYGLKILEKRILHHNKKSSAKVLYAIVNMKNMNKQGTRFEMTIASELF